MRYDIYVIRRLKVNEVVQGARCHAVLTLMVPFVPTMNASFGNLTLEWVQTVAVFPPLYFRVILALESTPFSFNSPCATTLSGNDGPKTNCASCRV